MTYVTSLLLDSLCLHRVRVWMMCLGNLLPAILINRRWSGHSLARLKTVGDPTPHRQVSKDLTLQNCPQKWRWNLNLKYGHVLYSQERWCLYKVVKLDDILNKINMINRCDSMLHELIEARRVKRRLESLGIYQSTAQVLSAHSVCFICFSTGVWITDSFDYLVWFVNKIENSSNS